MNQLAQELDEKLRTLDPLQARNLELLVRDAIVQVEQGAMSASLPHDRKAALHQLIGIWKTDKPLTDEEVDQIVEEERMKKFA